MLVKVIMNNRVKVEVNYDVSNDKYNIVKVEDKVKDK